MKKIIELELLKYGFLPLLIVLERMEIDNEFEICQTIVEVLNTHSKKYNLELPTKLSGSAIAEYKLAFMTNFNLSGDIAVSNSEIYANEIEQEIAKNIKSPYESKF